MEFGETSRKTGFISAAACVELMKGDADRFKGKCEIAVKLHISDKHKERC